MPQELSTTFWSFCWLVVLVVIAWPLGIMSSILFNILLPLYSQIRCLEPCVVLARSGMELPHSIAVNVSLGTPMVSFEPIRKEIPRAALLLDDFRIKDEDYEWEGGIKEYSNKTSEFEGGRKEHSDKTSNFSEHQDFEQDNRLLKPTKFFSSKSQFQNQNSSIRSSDNLLNEINTYSDKYVQTDKKSVSFSNKLIRNDYTEDILSKKLIRNDYNGNIYSMSAPYLNDSRVHSGHYCYEDEDSDQFHSINTSDINQYRHQPKFSEVNQYRHPSRFSDINQYPHKFSQINKYRHPPKFNSDHFYFSPIHSYNNRAWRSGLRVDGLLHYGRNSRCKDTVRYGESSDWSSDSTSFSSAISHDIYDNIRANSDNRKRVIMKKKVYKIYHR